MSPNLLTHGYIVCNTTSMCTRGYVSQITMSGSEDFDTTPIIMQSSSMAIRVFDTDANIIVSDQSSIIKKR